MPKDAVPLFHTGEKPANAGWNEGQRAENSLAVEDVGHFVQAAAAAPGWAEGLRLEPGHAVLQVAPVAADQATEDGPPHRDVADRALDRRLAAVNAERATAL